MSSMWFVGALALVTMVMAIPASPTESERRLDDDV